MIGNGVHHNRILENCSNVELLRRYLENSFDAVTGCRDKEYPPSTVAPWLINRDNAEWKEEHLQYINLITECLRNINCSLL